ncbi:hypothetical protein GCM10025868_20390 [Angustibacter aerolatus]|uniref:LytR/CpsA/Psr regulator C-terminal domain-containing protein n=1 Tax=Angustibacter aerolatus TaxID=1162965 RepID=A0ABQ6JG76_9ACTN|nr:hypothetical protein GCM10025868_20390 [Angustibacter aerolatus]
MKVLNSSGASGLAKQAGAALAAQGFDVTGTGNGAGAAARGAVVHYPEGQREAARTLAAAFPKASLMVDDTLSSGFVVDLGKGSPSVVAVPNRVGTDDLPAQPVKAPAVPRSATPTITARVASDTTCSEG